jgi:hypothetical protein
MSADLLRQAATRLRTLIGTPSEDSEDFVIPGPWNVAGRQARWEIVPELDESYDVVAQAEYGNEARYIATMHPGVGLALADLLDGLAEDHWDFRHDEALTIARLIVGDA